MTRTKTLPLRDRDLDADIARARTRAALRRSQEPYAVSATYSAARRRIEVELSNGFSFAVPSALFDDLGRASPEDLAEVEIDASGYALHWPAIDSDYEVGGMVQVALGAKKWMSVRELGRLGGKATSEAKRAAAATNGLKGGRPPKTKSESRLGKNKKRV